MEPTVILMTGNCWAPTWLIRPLKSMLVGRRSGFLWGQTVTFQGLYNKLRRGILQKTRSSSFFQ